MDLWTQIEALLLTFEDSEAHQSDLRRLTSRLPAVLDAVSVAERERVQALGAEALYQAGELERVIAWIGQPLGAASALWLGHALFDLQRYAEALPHLQRAKGNLPLQDWARVKIHELIICIGVRSEPSRVTIDEIGSLHAQYESLGVDAPVPLELRRTLAQAEVRGSLPTEVLRYAHELFGR